ncbi:5935_t:CDS:2 [Entrophospora sp. SA101]|nr:12952_t:CDS:2 [Entrophospora sp. SA101]CAJ0755211.1 5935_t:CDS:2 [Entrophospora sp. SA101]
MTTRSTSDKIDVEIEEQEPSTPTLPLKKPWYKTPSAYWLLPMFVVIAMTSGLAVAVGVQIYLSAACYEYYSQNGEASIPLSFHGAIDECNNADVQAVTAKFLVKANFCTAIPGSFIDGVTGGFYALSEASYAYATDSTHPTRRSVIFGWIQGTMFAGFMAGPTLGGLLVKATNSLLSVYYVTLAVYITLFLFYLFILPESLTKEKLALNVKRQQEQFAINWTGFKSIDSVLRWVYVMFRPLLLFLPNGRRQQDNDNDKVPIAAPKYSFTLLGIVYSLLSSSIMAMSTVYVLYTSLVFNWSLLDQGYFVFLMSGTKVFVLFVLYPLIVKFKKPILGLTSKFKVKILALITPSKNTKNSSTEEKIVVKDDNGMDVEICTDNVDDKDDEKLMRNELIFEVRLIKLIFFIDALAHVAYGLSTSSAAFNAVTVIASLGIITTPAIKSLQTNLISPSQIGQLLGGISVIDSILRIFVPPLFDFLYSVLVKTQPNVIWHCISILLFIAFFVSFGIRPAK